MVISGVDITTVKESVGHRFLMMPHRYSHLSLSHKVYTLKILDNAINDSRQSIQKCTIWREMRKLHQVRDLENTKIPFIMSPYYKTGGIDYEDIDPDSKWSIPRNGGLDFSVG